MKRLKEGFYSIMKLSDAVLKDSKAKEGIIEFSNSNKIEKPETDVFIKVNDIKIQVEEESTVKQ